MGKEEYQAYHIDNIQDELLSHYKAEQIELIKSHILSIQPKEIGANCIDIYLVAYVAENYGTGKITFFNFI